MNWIQADEAIIPFHDREHAGLLLADKLKGSLDKNTLVLAIPRGGVVTGKSIADHLGMEIDLLLCKKIGHPQNPEYAIGSVCANGTVIESGKADRDLHPYIESESEKLKKWLKERYFQLSGRKLPIEIKHRIVLICDDGIATGNTMKAAVKSVQQNGAEKIFLATPVISSSALAQLLPIVTNIFFLHAPENFRAVGEFYISFPPVNDNQVKSMMKS